MDFNFDTVSQTFATYKKGQVFDGVVVSKREDGVIFNIGGKNDAFISCDDFDQFEEVKIGDRFKVMITNSRNEEGFVEVSKRQADSFVLGNQNAEKLRLGSKFTFVATAANEGLCSKMGEYDIFVPAAEVSTGYVRDLKALVGKQFEAVIVEYDRQNKKIIASIKLLQEQEKEQCETLFWNSIFINKIVSGKVKKILPYGIFASVDGVDCFCHISNLSHERIVDPSAVVKEGETLAFKVIEVDRENKKVALGLKQLQQSPKEKAMEELEIGQICKGEVVKILQFGALVKLENGAVGLLHISNATEKNDKNIYEIVKLGDLIKVSIVSLDKESQRIGLKLEKK